MNPLKTILALFIIAMALNIQPLSAQESPRTLERLSDINRINPLQNPEFTRSEDILDRKIIDRKNKVIGQVKDITLKSNGTIETIVTDFDRLRLGDDVPLNFREMSIRPVSDAYALSMNADEVSDFYPQLLASIATASGDQSNIFSAHKIVGAKIRAEDGRNMGHVESILFSNNGSRAAALYVELNIGTTRGDMIAVPFRATTLASKSGRISGIVSDDLADAMISVANN